MPRELTPTRPTIVRALYATHADDATRPDIVPVGGRFADDATRPDILPARLRLEEESFDARNAPRYVRTEYLAHGDWPDVRLAHWQSHSDAASAVVLHHPNRRIKKTAGTRHPSTADLFEQRLHHPLVIPVLDLASLDGELVVVSEYVAGVTLAELLREGGPLRPAMAIAIACDVLRALQFGHAAISTSGEPLECVHGSLSPSDVLVCADGRSRLVDFSLAASASATAAERSGGRGGYVSPEQVFDRRCDARSDVFLVGVSLWESLTGYGLLAGDNPVERLMKLVSEGFDPPSRFNAEVPDWLDDAVVRALDPAPNRRFQSAAEFANALAATLRPASAADVAEYVALVGGPCLERQQLSRRAASEPPPASGARRTRPASGTRANADASTVPTVRPPRIERAAAKPVAVNVAPATRPKVEPKVAAAHRVHSTPAQGIRLEPRAPAPETNAHTAAAERRTPERSTERPPLEARVAAQPVPPLEVRRPSSQRPPRSLRLATFCAASAAIALLAAVTGVELARTVNDIELAAPPLAPRGAPAPTSKPMTPRPATTSEASPRSVPSAETDDVPVVTLDELPVGKASKRKKPSRRWRAPAKK